MDQPNQPNASSGISLEWIITSILVGLGGIGSLWARSKIKIDGLREKVKAESAPQIETAYLSAHKAISLELREEVKNLREEVRTIRKDSREEIDRERQRADDWEDRARTCEARIPAMQIQIDMLQEDVKQIPVLQAEVVELRRQLAERGQRA